MNKRTWTGRCVMLLALLGGEAVFAQQRQGPPGGPGGTPPKPPMESALDVNGDSVISAEEIANAPAALGQLDKNGDGQLTTDELRPPPPQ